MGEKGGEAVGSAAVTSSSSAAVAKQQNNAVGVSTCATNLVPSLCINGPTLGRELRAQAILVRTVGKLATLVGVKFDCGTGAAKVDELLVDDSDEVLALGEDDLALVGFAIVLA